MSMTLILVMGLPGTGKTVLANDLSSFLPNNPIYLSTDSIRRNVFNFSKHQYAKFGEKLYSSKDRQLIYNVLNFIVEILIKQQLSVIVDGTFYSKATRKPFYEICNR
ncbi:MAG: AAA family ATPase, partial [Candidatus Hodarchaeales archaeon]